jgi:hypothetical protein
MTQLDPVDEFNAFRKIHALTPRFGFSTDTCIPKRITSSSRA